MALLELGTTDYGIQELQSLISSYLENYIYGEKESLNLLVSKESGPIKKSISEDRTSLSTKEVELQNKNNKIRAEIQVYLAQTRDGEILENLWSLPLPDGCLAQLTLGKTRKIKAKTVHIFNNRNGKQKGSAVLEFSSKENKKFALKHRVDYYNQRLIWEEKTVEKEGSFKQQDLKFKSEVVENKMRYEKERQKVSGESNMIIRAKPSKTKEKNKAKQYTESDRKKKTKIHLVEKIEKLCSKYIEELKDRVNVDHFSYDLRGITSTKNRFSNRAGRKPSTVFLTGAKVVQAKIGTTRRLDIPSSTDQKLDSHSICLNKNKRKIDDFLELKVKIHNINGVKNNSYRLQELVDFGTREKFNLLGIVETNIIVDKEIL
ncbi:hypothetical protein C2G38_2197424 [Gigaspora rosea]|uniref:Uncharacterized protein n=1 Tax=Gigaspora rosea TaxID=44941 RepID=A0A397V110_9GLOM|nr:hypothetical protein C2G38_2197424 [Gigaspora rosea]